MQNDAYVKRCVYAIVDPSHFTQPSSAVARAHDACSGALLRLAGQPGIKLDTYVIITAEV